MYDESLYADRCLNAGAMGYLNKEADPDEVIKAIRVVFKGRVYVSPAMSEAIVRRAVGGGKAQTDPVGTLTDRQLEVFRLMGDGCSARQIAARLHISIHTVETHRDNIKRKLNVDTVAELTRRAVLWVTQQ
jgi:DNA-binding NarL/FixJ family response regulator